MKRYHIIPEIGLVTAIKVLVFSLFLVPLITSPDFYFPFIVPRNLYFRVIVELVALAYLVLVLQNRNFFPRKNMLWTLVLAFFGVMTLSSVINGSLLASFWGNYERMEGLVTYFHLLALLIVVVGTFRKKEDWDDILQASLFSTFMVAFVGLSQILGANVLLASSGGDRTSSTLGNATYVAALMMINIFIVFYFALRKKSARDFLCPGFFSISLVIVLLWLQYQYAVVAHVKGIIEQIFTNPILALLLCVILGIPLASFAFRQARQVWVRAASSVYYGVLALLFLFVLAKTQTRGALIGLVVGSFFAGVLALFRKDQKKSARFVAGGLVLALVLSGAALYLARSSKFVIETPILQKLTSISLSDSTTKTRILAWQSGFKGFTEKPILGWGVENFGVVFNEHFPVAIYTDEGTPLWYDRPHNLLVQYLVEGGVVGFGLYLALMGMLAFYLIRKQPQEYRGIVLSGLLVAYLVQNLFVFDSINSYIIFYIILGFAFFLIGEHDSTEERQPRAVSTVVGWSVTGISLIALILLVQGTILNVMHANQGYVALYREQVKAGSSYDPSATKKMFDFLDRSPYVGKAELLGVYSEFVVGRLRDESVDPNEMKSLIAGLVERFDHERAAGYDRDARFNMFELNLMLNAGYLDPTYYTHVVELAGKTIPLSPDRPQLYSIRGRAYMSLMRTQEGLADFKHAVELAPHIPEGHMNLFKAYLTMGDRAKAQEELMTLSTVSPLDMQIIPRITAAYLAAGYYSDAVNLLEEALVQFPRDAASIYIGMAQVYAAAGDTAKAREAMRSAVEKDPQAASYAEDFYRRLEAGELLRK